MIADHHDIAAFKIARPDKDSQLLCHAPFKSIFFNMGGKLFTCCFNRIYMLGTYPQQSIREIWFGEKANQLRQAIRENDLSLGCHLCGHLLAAKNYGGLPIKNFDYAPWDENGYPTKMDFELGNTCNLECVMCRGEHSSSIRQNREKKPPLDPHYDDAFLKQLDEFIPHLKIAHFLGGEPFLMPIYLDLWERMIELNPEIAVSVQTNATIMNERVRKILEKMRFSISVSIDSIEKATYEQIRLNAKFERVMENIQFFRQYCAQKGTRLNICYCPMVQNWSELPRVVAFCNALNAEVFFNTVTLPVHCSLSYLPSAELKKIAAYYESHELPAATPLEQLNKKSYYDVINQINYWQQQAERKEQHLNGQQGVRNLKEFLELLKKVSHDYITSGKSKDAGLYEDIEQKLDYILHEAEQEGILAETQEYLCAIDPVVICDFFPNTEKEHLYSTMKTHAGLH